MLVAALGLIAAQVAANVHDACYTSYEAAVDAVYLCLDDKGVLQNPQNDLRDIDDNDVFVIRVIGSTDPKSLAVEMEGAFASGDSAEVVGGSSSQNRNVLPGKPDYHYLGTFGPFASPSVTLKVYKLENTTKTLLRQLPIRINKTYVAAFRLAAIKSDTRFNDFAIVTAPDGQRVVINKAAEGDDMRYLIAVEPYGWRGWWTGQWRGRDIAKAPRLLDRFNPIVGFALKNVTDEWLAGGSFEFARGFTAIAALHRAKVDTLAAGTEENVPVPTTFTSVPTTKRWAKKEWVFGVGLDLRIATQMLGSLFK